jgi:hypothetical protein
MGAPVSERDDRPADDSLDAEAREQSARSAAEGVTRARSGALDGAAAAGGLGAVGGGKPDSVMPQEAPDPSIGPD